MSKLFCFSDRKGVCPMIRNDTTQRKNTAGKRFGIFILAVFLLTICNLPDSAFAAGADAKITLTERTAASQEPSRPARPRGDLIRWKAKALYEKRQQYSMGRWFHVDGPYIGSGLEITFSKPQDSDIEGWSVKVVKKKKTPPAPDTNTWNNHDLVSTDHSYTSQVLQPNTTYYIYIATCISARREGASNYDATGSYLIWSKWSKPVAVKTGPSTKPNPITAKARTVTVSAAKVRKKNQSFSASDVFTVKKYKGKLTYKTSKELTPNAAKQVSISKNGKVTVKKGTKAGTYRLSVSITDSGDITYRKISIIVAFDVIVK